MNWEKEERLCVDNIKREKGVREAVKTMYV